MHRYAYGLLLAGLLAIAFSFFSCKKKKAFKDETGQASVEVRNAQGEEDAALWDINTAMAAQWLIRGNRTAAGSHTVFGDVCGLTIDTTQAGQGILQLNYDGSPCNGRTRSGSIIITVQNYPANKLRSVGCQVKIDFNAYLVTRKTSGSSLQLDGTLNLTNESGGSLYELTFLNQPALIEDITAEQITVTLNGVSLFYTISRRISYAWSDSTVTCTETGTGTQAGNSNMDSWGFTRDKQQFTSQVTKPVVWTSVCGPLYPISGEVTVKEKDKDFDLKSVYGLDAAGTPVSPGSGCAFGFNTSWSYKSSTVKRLFDYDN